MAKSIETENTQVKRFTITINCKKHPQLSSYFRKKNTFCQSGQNLAQNLNHAHQTLTF